MALVVAYVAAARDLWWLTGVAAVCGGSSTSSAAGAGCAPTARSRPASVRAESTLWIALAVALAVAGLVLLVLER